MPVEMLGSPPGHMGTTLYGSLDIPVAGLTYKRSLCALEMGLPEQSPDC